jgi:stage V sporulation protein AF
MQNPSWIPEAFEFIMVKETVNVALIWQFLILELSIDGLRLAAVNTPSMLTTPLSVTAGLVLGEFSVKSGWFNSEVMLYMAFVAIANYTHPSYELGYAIKFFRIITLILTAIFNLWGFVAGVVLFIAAIVSNRMVSGQSYLYPLIPFSFKKLGNALIRKRLPDSKE